MRIDERSMQPLHRESAFAPNSGTTGQGEFYDPETASRSGMSNVPSQPSRIPSPRGMIRCDSCLPHNTRNSMITLGNVCEDLPRHGRRIETRTAECNNTDSSIYQESRDLESCVSYWRNLRSKIVWWKFRGTLSRSCSSENSDTQVTFNVGESISRPQCV